MNTPVNGETFLPQLLVDYFTAQRTNLGLPAALNLYASPYLGTFTRPCLVIESPSFRMIGHPMVQEYDVHLELQYNVDGEPATSETEAAAKARRDAILATENTTLSLIRAALALRTGQTLSAVGTVKSLFDWVTVDRTAPAGEDNWALEDITIAAGGGGITFNADTRLRHRGTSYVVRFMSNEFTV